mgnify:CR=1 FL=1|jgi:hypothetical protein
MNDWKTVSTKKQKELLYSLNNKYIGKSFIGKFNRNRNLGYITDIINNKDIAEIYLENNEINCFVMGDILELTISKITSNFIYYGNLTNVIRRKYSCLFGIIHKFDYHNYYIYSNILGKKYIIKTQNLKQLKLYDKVIFKIVTYQNNNNIYAEILRTIGNLNNTNEIFDTILVEENFINCDNLTNNLVHLTNFENACEINNNQFNKNYDKEQLINTKINYNLVNDDTTFNGLYYDNNLFIYHKENNILKIGFMVDYFIGNRHIYNSNKQLFYRNLYTNNLFNNDDSFLNNNHKKYFNEYKNNKNENDFRLYVDSRKFHKLWIIEIDTNLNIIADFSFHVTKIKMIDNLDDSFKMNILNNINNVNYFNYYYQRHDNNTCFINLFYHNLKLLIFDQIKEQVKDFPVRKSNKYEYDRKSKGCETQPINNIFDVLDIPENDYSNRTITTNNLPSVNEIKTNLNMNLSYSNIVSFNANTFINHMDKPINGEFSPYLDIYKKIFETKNINNYYIYKPKNIHMTDIKDLFDDQTTDIFFNPYNNFFDSYVLKLILKLKGTKIKIDNFKENYDNNIYKILETCNISEKICYKVEQRIHQYQLFDFLKNNRNYNKITGKIIHITNDLLLIDSSIGKYHFILNILNNGNQNIGEIVSLNINNIDIVKKYIFAELEC